MATTSYTRNEAKKAAQYSTMACWWPNKSTGKQTIDWASVKGELQALADSARMAGRWDEAMKYDNIKHAIQQEA